MFLDLSPNVKGKLPLSFAFLFLILSPLSWAKVPYSNSELRAVENSQEARIRELRNEEVTQLRIALGRRSPVHRQADLYFRLAQIYLESYRSEFLLEGRAHEKRLEKGMEDQFIDRSRSRPYLSAGIQACKEILGFKIHYDKLDQIYYFMGFYYGELDNKKESAHYFSELIRLFPNSVFAGAATKELGEYAFNSSDFRKATGYLERSLQKTSEEYQPPILHKLAWSYYRIKQYDRAITTMKAAVSACSRHKEKFGPLRDEALRDMATLMTENGRVDEAIQYFQEAAGDQAYFPKVLEKLGSQYERNVEIPQAIKVYETLLKTKPESDEAFRVLVKLVELDLKEHHYHSALGRLKSLRAQKGGDSETQAAAQNLRVMIRKTATEHHQEYRKKKTRPDLEIAEPFYTAYINSFLKQSDSHNEIPEIQMYLAEIKHELGKKTEVVELYRQIVASQDKRYAKEAALLWISSIVEAMKVAHHQAGESPDEPSALEKQFIDASDLLQKSLPESNEAKESSLKVTQVLAGYKNTRAEAIQRIQAILSRFPRSSQALVAAQLWYQLVTDQKLTDNWTELNALIKELRANSQLMENDQKAQHGKLKAALEDQEKRIQVATIAKYEKLGDFASAAKGYIQFAQEAPQKDVAEKAYFNAISAYLKLEDSNNAILSLAETWSKRFPKSTKEVDALRTVATNALIRGQFDFSVQLFKKIGLEQNDASSFETAARLYEAMGDVQQAQKEWSNYLDLFKNASDRWTVTLNLARSYEVSHMESEASRFYRICANGPPAFFSECTSRLADLYLKNKDIQQAKTYYRSVAFQVPKKKGEPLSPFVGYCRYKLAELLESEATFEPMKFPLPQLQKGLTQRLNFVEPLSKAYNSAQDVGGPWAIAALNRLALWATHFADEVDAIEAPSSLQGPGLEKFRKDLASVSGPLREKAKSTWNNGYSKAAAVSLMSPLLPEVADHLADFRVSVPGRSQGPRGKFHLSGISADGGPEGSKIAFPKVRERLIKNAQDSAAWIDYGNLLWGQSKPLMAKLAYERALALNPKSAPALNNLGVVKILSEGEEDWITIAEGVQIFQSALKMDDFFVPAKMNFASLLNYYRLFSKAKQLWDQVLVKNTTAEAQDGLGVAMQGVGNLTEAEWAFKKANELGADKNRFAWLYFQAARASVKGRDGAGDCISYLEDLKESTLAGFEKSSVAYLKGKCILWKKKS